jgi:hypothetical protein
VDGHPRRQKLVAALDRAKNPEVLEQIERLKHGDKRR